MSTSCRKSAANNADFTTKLQAVAQDILKTISYLGREPYTPTRERGGRKRWRRVDPQIGRLGMRRTASREGR